MAKFWAISGGAARLIQRFFAIDSGGAARQIKRGFVIDSTGTARLFYQLFGGSTLTFPTAGSFTATIPQGATQIIAEVWGAAGGGGGGFTSGGADSGGGGGGSGGLARSLYALTSANWGQTIAVLVGAAGTSGMSVAGASQLSSGTYSLPAPVTGDGGFRGNNSSGITVGGTGGGGGSASGGNQVNTPGRTGSAGQSNAGGSEGGAGAPGVTGTLGTGTGGGQGAMGAVAGASGGAGLVILKFS
jgi:hypothetical protein